MAEKVRVTGGSGRAGEYIISELAPMATKFITRTPLPRVRSLPLMRLSFGV